MRQNSRRSLASARPPATRFSPSRIARRSRDLQIEDGARTRCATPLTQQQPLPPSFSNQCCSPRADDGVGPSVDEFFTLSLGGMATVSARPSSLARPAPHPLSSHRRPSRAQLLNTSSNSIFAGDLVEWSLSYSMAQRGDSKRQRQGPRRIGAHASFRLPSHAVAARRSPFTLLRFQASRPRPCLRPRSSGARFPSLNLVSRLTWCAFAALNTGNPPTASLCAPHA